MRLNRCPCLSESIGDDVFAKAAIEKKDKWVYAAWEIELFPNKESGRLSSKKAMEGAHRWGCKSETTVR